MSAEVTPQRVREIGIRLIDLWKSQVDQSLLSYGKNPARTATVFSLSAHAFRLGEVALRLTAEGLALEVLPTVRATYETALRAHWVAQIEEGVQIFLLDGMDRRKRMAADFVQLPWPGAAEASSRAAELDDPAPYEQFSRDPRSVRALCNDLSPGGIEAYALYRYLSMMAHPTPFLSDEYLREGDDPNFPVKFRLEPKEQEPRFADWVVTAALLWAARATSFFDSQHTWRSELRSYAREIGVPDVMSPSDAYRARVRAHKQK